MREKKWKENLKRLEKARQQLTWTLQKLMSQI